MAKDIDLYKDDLAVFGDPEVYAAVETFTRVASPPTDRAQEGYLLDFKASWSDSALRTVAAFANTFGGLLFVGVGEQQGRADQIVGILAQRQELKTSIASSIASNITPTPPYEIRDVAFPDRSGKHLCIVRVRKGAAVYLLTKKGEQPVYIRNEDESRPADAARLQVLLATRAVPGHHNEFAIAESIPIPQNLYVTQMQPIIAPGLQVQPISPGGRIRSESFFRLCLLPEESLRISIDQMVERQLLYIVRGNYPELSDNVDDSGRNLNASLTEARTRDSYQITYTEVFRDYEMRWVATSSGAVYFVSQVRCKAQKQAATEEGWSLADLMTNIDCTIETAHVFWDYLNYPGEARILAELDIQSLPLLERSGGGQAAYASAYYEKDGSRKRARPLVTSCLLKPAKQGQRASAVVDITYAARFASHAEPVSILANQLLRDLGYSANLTDLASLL